MCVCVGGGGGGGGGGGWIFTMTGETHAYLYTANSEKRVEYIVC